MTVECSSLFCRKIYCSRMIGEGRGAGIGAIGRIKEIGAYCTRIASR